MRASSATKTSPSHRIALAASVCWILAGASSYSSVKTWDGGGTNNNWSTAANWDLDSVPAANDSLVFAGAANSVNTNDLTAGTVFNGISFSAGAGAFALNGNGLVLSG